jgi:serine/threonine-protein kinase
VDAVEQHLEACPACVRLLGAAAAMFQTSPAAPGGRGVLEPGTVLKDTYTVIRLVGRGGMGEVYEVGHVRLAGRYAVKILRADISEDRQLLSRFRREAEITSALRHPNIVQVIDFDLAPDGSAFLVMEFLAGSDLARLLRREGCLPLARVRGIVAQTSSALSAVHKQGIVHRDLKPENVFVVPGEDAGEERVKLMDFGLSKWSSAPLEQSLRLSRDQALIGTPRYMAPEQAMARNQEVGPATDQFALAALAYEMLAGAPAFKGDSLAELLHAIAYEEPMDLRALRRDLSPAVAQAIHRGLQKRAADRFPSVQDFARALSSPEAATAGITRWRSRWARLLGAAVVTAALSLAATITWSGRGPTDRPGTGPLAPSPAAAVTAPANHGFSPPSLTGAAPVGDIAGAARREATLVALPPVHRPHRRKPAGGPPRARPEIRTEPDPAAGATVASPPAPSQEGDAGPPVPAKPDLIDHL